MYIYIYVYIYIYIYICMMVLNNFKKIAVKKTGFYGFSYSTKISHS